MANYTRGHKIDRAGVIQKLINGKSITPDGADWITLRTDPYHDFQRPVAGYPDADGYNTIVSCLNYETTVSKPAGAAGNWDAHVFTLPVTSGNYVLSTATNAQCTGGTQSYNLGLVNVAKDDSGGDLFPVVNPVVAANFSMAEIDGFDEVTDGMSRIIGMGLEIIDTTAVLNKQGSLACYRVPAHATNQANYGFTNNGTTYQVQLSGSILMSPPSKLSEAVLYRSTVQWEAKEGAYMSIAQQGLENPFRMASKTNVVISPTTDMPIGTTVVLVPALQTLTALQAPPLLTAATDTDSKKLANIAQSGVFITGLANAATFKVRVRVYVERSPHRTETSLIPLASPSAPYDYKALALYSMLTSELPVAVPVAFNAKGDWWRWIARTIGALAPTIGAVLTPLVGPSAAPIAAVVGTALTELGAKQKENKKKQKNRLLSDRTRPQKALK